MTIPLSKDDLRFSVTVLDNYYTEDDNAPKVLAHKIFKTLEAAKEQVDRLVQNPKAELKSLGIEFSEDQLVHQDDIHVVLKDHGAIVVDKLAYEWEW